MMPPHFGTGLTASLLATSCAAFFVPFPEQAVLRHASRSPAFPSTSLDVRATTAARPRVTRLAFSLVSPDGDDATAAAAHGGRLAAGPGSGDVVGLATSRKGKAAGALKAVSGADGGDLEGGEKDLTTLRRAVLLTVWLLLTAYAFGPLAPGVVADPKDLELVTHLYDVAVDAAPPETAVYVNVFNALGFLPAEMASVLIGGGAFGKGRQPVPPQPFVFGAFALGFFSVGPYLLARNYLPQSAMEEGEEMSVVEKALTSKFFAAPVLVLSAYTMLCLVSALTNPENVAGFLDLFWSSKLAHISTLDFLVLSVAIVDPIREDMRRRGVEPEAARVALHALPLVGPALWLLVRPPVE